MLRKIHISLRSRKKKNREIKNEDIQKDKGLET